MRETSEFDKAHAEVDQALSAYPNVAALHFSESAGILASSGNCQSVEAELNKAIELDPNYVAAYSALAALYINAKQEDRAIAEYQKNHRATS